MHTNSGNIQVDKTQIEAIIEEPGFLKQYSGKKNLKLLASLSDKPHKDFDELLALVGLSSAGQKHVGKYSMGMKQHLGIAQAIMENQQILILDEPMNGLDNQGVQEIRDLFLKLKKEGKTILLASHNREDIDVLCDEVYEMNHGIYKCYPNSELSITKATATDHTSLAAALLVLLISNSNFPHKKGVCTLKNQCFSSQNSAPAVSEPYSNAFSVENAILHFLVYILEHE